MTQRPDRTRLILRAVAVLLLAYLVGANIRTQFNANEQADQKAQAQQQAAQNAQDAKAVADPLAELCRTDPSVAQRVGDACQKAAEVQRDQKPVVLQPKDGRGITSTAIEAGRLVVSYSDGARRDVGQVVGQPGATGATGEPGRGVVATVLDGVDLVVIYSDGQRENLGRIVGRDGDPGRGIASVDASTGRLIITFDDGTTQDAGELPRGERGPPPAGWTVQRADGSTERCSRDPGSSDDAPTYSCTASSGPTAPPAETTTETTTVTVTPEPTEKPGNGGLLPSN